MAGQSSGYVRRRQFAAQFDADIARYRELMEEN